MTRSVRCLVAIVVLALALPMAAQAPLEIKLATVSPRNSIWEDELRNLGNAWSKATGGRVTLRIFAGGTRGTESTYLKLMRVDELQAALLLPPGLAEIDEAFNVLGMPFFFESDEEAQRVLAGMTPLLSQRLQARGFHLINWGSAGWVYLFSKQPVRTLDEMKKGRLFTTEGNDAMVQWYKANGFHPVPMPFNDIPAALLSRTGGIDIVPAPPLAAATMFFRNAPNMLDIRIAPLIAATVITTQAWNQIAAADRTAMLTAAAAMEKSVIAGASALDAKEIANMRTRGLTVHTPTSQAAAEFRKAADALIASMRGGMVPADVFDLALKERSAYRASTAR